MRPLIRTIPTSPILSSSHFQNLMSLHNNTQRTHASDHINMFQLNAHLGQLVKTGHLYDARKMFDEMPKRDETSWTAIISGYVNTSQPHEALTLFAKMWVQPGLRLDEFVLNLALKACGISLSFHFGEALHGCSIKSGLVNSIYVGNSVLDMYMKMGKIEEGRRVFEDMPLRNVVSWTGIITRLVHAGYYTEGLVYFSEMWRSKSDCDEYTYAITLKACADMSVLNHGMAIHAQTLKRGLDETSFVPNSLATMYNKCGELEKGFHLFSTMKKRDVVSWTMIITTYLTMGREKEAIEVFVRMRESGVSPNDYTFAAVVSCCANLGRLEWSEQLHGYILRLGLSDYLSVANSIVTMYSKCGQLASASIAFRAMRRKDIVSWSAIIAGYCQGGYGEEAFEYFSQMRNDGPKPNEFALSSLLSVCGSMSAFNQGTQLHGHVLLLGIEHKSLIQSSLINMYSKCGSIKESTKVFKSIEENNIVTWTAMIGGYAEHGHSREAIHLFEEMTNVGLRPDAVTFVGVLTACSHVGLVDLGFKYFNSMITEYRINPSKEHYGCVIDLLCRAGRLSEAERVIRSMPFKQDDIVWSNLLRACRVRGDIDRGRCAAEEILKMNPNCAGTHITLANIYAADGKWRESSELRKVLKSKGVSKEPGWSWIKVRNRVCAFVAGDTCHSQINSVLKSLLLKPEIANEELSSSPMFSLED